MKEQKEASLRCQFRQKPAHFLRWQVCGTRDKQEVFLKPGGRKFSTGSKTLNDRLPVSLCLTTLSMVLPVSEPCGPRTRSPQPSPPDLPNLLFPLPGKLCPQSSTQMAPSGDRSENWRTLRCHLALTTPFGFRGDPAHLFLCSRFLACPTPQEE